MTTDQDPTPKPLSSTVILRKQKKVLRSEQWRWTFIAANGNVLARSSEGYANLSDALSALSTVLGVSPLLLGRSTSWSDDGLMVTRPFSPPVVFKIESPR